MIKRLVFILLLAAGCSLPLRAAVRRISVASPDNRLRFTLAISDRGIGYSVTADRRPVVTDAELGFDFTDGAFGAGLRAGQIRRCRIDETYRLPVGKVSEARAFADEVLVPLIETRAPYRRIDLRVRAFCEGIAFRYEFPEQAGWTHYEMTDERTSFDPAGNPRVLAMPLPGYTSTHENLYDFVEYDALKEGQLYEMPATFDYGEGLCMAVTEAAVRDYAGMYLAREQGHLRGKLSPRLDRPELKVVADSLPHRSPWRVLSIGRGPGDLMKSNILTHLNEPCAFDASWVRPCKTTFTWWNGNVVPDTLFSPGNNFETNRYYIDFAKRHKIDLHGIYGYAETPWYYDDGFNFGWPGSHADVTRPIPCLEMPRIAEYARRNGVGLHLWVHWKPLFGRLDEALALYESWGVRGMMVDFMDRDDQEMIRIQERILAAAARHHLFIQFHGASKPSGLHRTYPNEFTREGTLNYEVCKWDGKVTPDHDAAIPFTRMLAGSTDYHLGGFRAVRREEFTPRYINPTVMGTRGHMLAMYVVLENYLGMLCDHPAAYEHAAGFDFLCTVPQRWDAIEVPYAELNECVCVARRSGREWYLGALTNRHARSIGVPLDFLGEGRYLARFWTDRPGGDPNDLDCYEREVVCGERLTLDLAGDGGCVVRIVPIEESFRQ